jgi:diguanylate cyclase (GGDEF)-like protein
MEFSREIAGFVSEKIGGIVILEAETGGIVYADSFFTDKYGRAVTGLNANEVFGWLKDCPSLIPGAPAAEWENIDTADKKFYKFNSAMFEKDGKLYTIHQLTDITEYMGLNRDVTKYMSFFKKLSSFQTAILEKLTNSYQELLPVLTDFFKTDRAYFLIQRNEYIECVSYTNRQKTFENDRLAITGELSKALSPKNIGAEGTYSLLCSGNVSEQKFAIYLEESPNMDRTSLEEKTLINVIKLYAENALMREKLIYENERDHLTGLYNKGKYLERIKNEYPYRKSIAIFNFDVNNLKLMNDRFGHEAGDKLIIKGADSIRRLTGSNVHGYRMGGDEFLMVACDVSEKEADELKKQWENELARLNTLNDGIECVIAVGMSYGEGEYNLSELIERADELMYEDKKAKKKPGEEIR